MAGATDPVDRSARLAANEAAPLGPYLLFLGDTVERGYAKTAFGLCDWAPERCIGELALPGATVTTGIPQLRPVEVYACRHARLPPRRGLCLGGGSVADRRSQPGRRDPAALDPVPSRWACRGS